MDQLKEHALSKHKRAESFECQLCGAKLNTMSSLSQHVHKEHEKTFKCLICEAAFGTTGSLDHHIDARHGSSQDHQCHLCSVSCKTKHILKSHITRVHLETFKCLICGAKYASRSHLNRHSGMVHENKLEFECQSCDAKFSDKYNFNRHVKTVHAEELNHECAVKNLLVNLVLRLTL